MFSGSRSLAHLFDREAQSVPSPVIVLGTEEPTAETTFYDSSKRHMFLNVVLVMLLLVPLASKDPDMLQKQQQLIKRIKNSKEKKWDLMHSRCGRDDGWHNKGNTRVTQDMDTLEINEVASSLFQRFELLFADSENVPNLSMKHVLKMSAFFSWIRLHQEFMKPIVKEPLMELKQANEDDCLSFLNALTQQPSKNSDLPLSWDGTNTYITVNPQISSTWVVATDLLRALLNNPNHPSEDEKREYAKVVSLLAESGTAGDFFSSQANAQTIAQDQILHIENETLGKVASVLIHVLFHDLVPDTERTSPDKLAMWLRANYFSGTRLKYNNLYFHVVRALKSSFFSVFIPVGERNMQIYQVNQRQMETSEDTHVQRFIRNCLKRLPLDIDHKYVLLRKDIIKSMKTIRTDPTPSHYLHRRGLFLAQKAQTYKHTDYKDYEDSCEQLLVHGNLFQGTDRLIRFVMQLLTLKEPSVILLIDILSVLSISSACENLVYSFQLAASICTVLKEMNLEMQYMMIKGSNGHEYNDIFCDILTKQEVLSLVGCRELPPRAYLHYTAMWGLETVSYYFLPFVWTSPGSKTSLLSDVFATFNQNLCSTLSQIPDIRSRLWSAEGLSWYNNWSWSAVYKCCCHLFALELEKSTWYKQDLEPFLVDCRDEEIGLSETCCKSLLLPTLGFVTLLWSEHDFKKQTGVQLPLQEQRLLHDPSSHPLLPGLIERTRESISPTPGPMPNRPTTPRPVQQTRGSSLPTPGSLPDRPTPVRQTRGSPSPTPGSMPRTPGPVLSRQTHTQQAHTQQAHTQQARTQQAHTQQAHTQQARTQRPARLSSTRRSDMRKHPPSTLANIWKDNDGNRGGGRPSYSLRGSTPTGRGPVPDPPAYPFGEWSEDFAWQQFPHGGRDDPRKDYPHEGYPSRAELYEWDPYVVNPYALPGGSVHRASYFPPPPHPETRTLQDTAGSSSDRLVNLWYDTLVPNDRREGVSDDATALNDPMAFTDMRNRREGALDDAMNIAALDTLQNAPLVQDQNGEVWGSTEGSLDKAMEHEEAAVDPLEPPENGSVVNAHQFNVEESLDEAMRQWTNRLSSAYKDQGLQ